MSTIIEAHEIAWGPPRKQNIVQPTSFRLETGNILGIVGPNGAGKSTLLRMLYRFHRPRHGEVQLEGQDIWKIDAKSCAQKIAVVLQEQPIDLALTVREIVSLGRLPHRRGVTNFSQRDNSIIDSILQTMELEEISHRQMTTLSGGEKQRVVMARALAQEPKLIILDEPTNHLDIRHQLELLSLLSSLELSIICTLHDLNMAVKFTDKLLIMSEGQSLVYGRPSEIEIEKLISEAFAVETKFDRLVTSGTAHLTFNLNQINSFQNKDYQNAKST